MNRAAAAICGIVMVLGGSGKLQAQQPSNPSQQLLKAAKSGTPAQVQQDLNNGANVNVKDSSGRTPLYFAADRVPGNAKNQILKILLAQPTIAVNDAATWGETPLYNASTGCDQFAVQILLYAGADPYLANQ